MFQPLTKPDLGKTWEDARVYCRPACFVDRPHELDDGCLRIADTMIWFAAWHVSLRDNESVRSAIVPISELDDWIAAMPDRLAEAVTAQRAAVVRPRGTLQLGERVVRLNEPQVMGILNVTPDSFSDGGKHIDTAAASEAGYALASAGAAIVDVGGESTRPGAPLVWEGDEIQRIEGVVSALAKGGVAVSIDTRKATVMEAALAAGATIVNDVSALRYDERAMEVVVRAGCPVVLMHAPSAKSDPHEGGTYSNILFDVYDMLAERIAACTAAGINPAKIIVDPGLGFGKGVADNLALVNGVALFHTLGCPILFGASRKRMIGALDNEAPTDQRLGGSVALHYQAATQGAQLLRVHDVAETRQALRVWRGLRDAALTA
ncbi:MULTISPECIES: dihydropteroate synthase [unclassified Sphingopyxis]|uniref:dihydropteroate synthase n=1 Tax=unclassified Sphingopyxis TaxID=2614943 RepID=UPI000731C166|nr:MULTISPECIES: dihydropteroate synthase [unclassified Sphingopyxis]KTE24494.1 dihydropteroate synthase [Sphingopyxis sp. H057]KTE49472.1 dihydropteroate synthase [Sphingopyxis sp. H071]KTE52165.1 dihydropteroate synthase [Sphingopyxis sp. H073]KTE60502.1 dihydropteroate synthase [Sphingopyxis sp. H107]KTE63909.1 dihydropteroate synthase [Sphingopyxis sp. H100]